MTINNPHATCQKKTQHLSGSLRRTRDEIKGIIGVLMDMDAGQQTVTPKQLAAQLHRTVSSISDDLDF